MAMGGLCKKEGGTIVLTGLIWFSSR